jgi:hypothetical protein
MKSILMAIPVKIVASRNTFQLVKYNEPKIALLISMMNGVVTNGIIR